MTVRTKPAASAPTIAAVFARCRAEGRAALIPYLTAGYPSLDALPDLVRAATRGGADLVEVGVPFSDPLADGPILQAVSQEALGRGFRLEAFWPVLAEAAGTGVPVVILTYVNPVLAVGTETFMRACRDAGAAGLIIPDVPWVEADPFRRLARRLGLDLIPLAAPTSTASHLAALASATGFVYAVSVTGVTGVRAALDPGVLDFLARLKAAVTLPVAIGFGISTPDQVRQVAGACDAVIVGSALMQALAARPDDAAMVVQQFVQRLRDAL